MPRQFSPSDRETVADDAADREWCLSVAESGPGLIAERDPTSDVTGGFAGLMKIHGWYVDHHMPEEGFYVLMPVTEVPA